MSASPDVPTKVCRQCGETKSLFDFYRTKRSSDGYMARCADCYKPPEKRERDRETARAWGRANRARHGASHAAYRRRWPERANARNVARRAVKKGVLVRQPCEICGDPTTHAHHEDYSRPLDVQWLCVKHHAEADRERQRRGR